MIGFPPIPPPMKTPACFRSVFAALCAAFLSIGNSGAINVSEGADFSNSSAGAATHVLTLGANTFSGTVTTTADGRDHFKVTVPAGMRITQVSKTVTGGGFAGFASFNNETISGTGSANFTGAFATPYPLPAGTYEAFINADFSTGASWSMAVTVGAAPDYNVTTTATGITVSDDAGNGDTLAVTQPAVGQIKFAVAGRNFSVNGGALISGDSGNLSLGGITTIAVNLGNGADTVNTGSFTGTSLPSLSIQAGGNDDTVNVNGDITLASGRGFDVFNAATLNMAAGCNVVASGSGDIYVDCMRNVVLGAGASLETVDGELWVEANQQTTVSTGNFSGINLDGAGTLLRTTGSGDLTVKGRGGNDAGGGQLGVGIFNGAKITGGTSGEVNVTGTGGASTNILNRGVTVYGAGSSITSGGAAVNVTGTAGALGSFYGIGVAVLFDAEISAGGTGAVAVTGNGAGAGGSGFNMGLELGGAASKITSSGGPVTVTGTAGPGGSFGIFAANGGSITTPLAGGNVTLEADSISIDATAAVTTLAAGTSATLQTHTSTTRIDLGGADDNAGTPKVLGLTDAELDRITTPTLVLSGASFATLTLSAAVSPANAPNLTLNADSTTGAIKPSVAGTDVTVSGTLKLDGPLSVPITGAAADSGFPQLKVEGGMNLNGKSLDLTGTTLAGTLNQTFILIDNDAADPVTGTFSGLPENGLIAWPGSVAFHGRINYAGGSGNDVVLTLVSALDVTTAADSGPGSLRSAIDASATTPGVDAITLSPALSGQTIALGTDITITDTAAVMIDASNLPGGLILSGGNATRHFTVPTGKNLTVKNLTFTGGNSGGNSGGAVLNTGSFTAVRCTFSGNMSGFGGGAVASIGATSVLSLENCTLAGNTAFFGGAVHHINGASTFTHCSVSRNTGTGGTGGMVLEAGAATFRHNIVAANSATGTPDVDLGGGGTVVTVAGANLIGNNSGNLAVAFPAGPLVGTPAEPLNPRLAPLGANGGPAMTLALLPGSPALDAGAVVAGIDTDQRGFVRNRDGNAVAGALPDLGAHEAQVAPVSIGFNFEGGDGGPGGSLAAADIAGVPAFSQANWNNLLTDWDGSNSGSAPNASTRNDATGTGIPALKLWWDAPNIWSRAGAPVTADDKLMWGYLDSNGFGDSGSDLYQSQNQPFLGVAGLPASFTTGGYRVVVYTDGDNTLGFVTEYWLTTNRGQNPSNVSGEIDLTPHLFSRDSVNFAGTYLQASATSAGSATDSNYAVFNVLTEPGFMVRASEPGTRAPINAVQVVRNEITVVTTAADELDPSGTLGTGISLREALRDAAPGGGIIFDPAVFNGEPGDTITIATANPGFVVDKDLTIDAGNIPGGVTVHAAASEANPKRVFLVNSGRTASLLGLNLAGGYVPTGSGGGLLNSGTATLTGCRFAGNTAEYGAAVASISSLSGPSRMVLRRCTASGNTATIAGGGLTNWATGGNPADLRVEDCAVTGNFASNFAGGLYNYSGGGAATFTALRTTVTGNSAVGGAGCGNLSGGGTTTMALSHCTVSGNTASTSGGGCYNYEPVGPTTLTLADTIVAGNSPALPAGNGPDFFNFSGTSTSLGGNLIGKTDASGVTWLGSDLTGTAASPLDPLLAPLGDYGGPTQTMALLPGSPAREAATASGIADQRGFAIVGAPDIGAYEAGTLDANFNAYIWESLPVTADNAQHAGAIDFDGDGASNQDEWEAQTDPADPASRFRILSVARSGFDLDISFTSEVGRHYGVDYSYDLETWYDAGGGIPGTGSPISFPVGPFVTPNGFLRIRVGP